MKNLWIILVLVLISIGCSATKKTKQTADYEKPVKFEIIGQASLHGNGKEGISKGGYVFKDPKAWEKFMSQMGRLKNKNGVAELPKIDFNKEMIIAVFAPVVGSGGITIDVEKVIETKTNLKVYSKTHTPSGFATMVMNQPYVVIKLPRIDKPVEWIGDMK